MANSEQFADLIVKNPQLKGTPEFNTVASALQETLAAEQVGAGQAEQYGENVLYEKPQVGVGRKLLQSGIKGVAGAIDLVAGGPENIKRWAQYATTPGMPVPPPASPAQTFLTKAGVLTPQAEFNTPVGRVADFTTQLATGGGINPYTAGRSLISKPLAEAGKDISRQFARAGGQGLVGGATSEALTSAGIESPVAKFLATGGAMGAAGAPFALRHTAADVANQATKNVTPEQITQAQELVKRSYSLGSPVTGAEALAKATGASPLTSVQRIVENSPQSSETMATFMAQRPEANAQMTANALRNISTQPVSSQTPIRLQQAGQNLISGAEKGLTESVSPFYKQAAVDLSTVQPNKQLPIMPSEIKVLQQNDVIKNAIDHVTTDDLSGAKGLKPSDPATLISAKKYLDAQYTRLSNKNLESYDKEKAANVFGATAELNNYLKEKSPVFAQGSRNYQIAQEQQIQPIKAGPVGAIAYGAGLPEELMAQQSKVMMPNAPRATTPADIKRTVDLLRRKDPTIMEDWTKQNLEGIFNETAQNLQVGPNQFGGAKFASTLRGNKQQADNLKALITESAGMQAYQGFNKVLDVLEAQGTRQGGGSMTSFNQQFQKELSEGGPLAAAKLVFKPSEIATKYEEWQLGKNTKKLANMLTNIDSIEQLKELARTGPRSAKAQTLVNSLLGGYISTKPQITEEQK